MDEGVADPQPKGWMASWIRDQYGKAQRLILSEAAARLGICETMSAAYAARFGVPFETFMNTADIERFSARVNVEPKKKLSLAYTGSLLPFSQEQSLRDIGAAVVRLHQQGISIRLDIYTPLRFVSPSIQSVTHPDCVFLHDAIENDDDYFQTLRTADILVSPVNFDAQSVHYIRYSMPTKIPSYLSSGTPILVYGPPGVAQVAYAKKERWAYVVDERDPELLQKGILALAQDLALRKTLSQAAVATTQRNHDSAMVRKRFQSVLAAAAHG
jgi:glycosyltransferase involved in cell wall biosynthesis